MLHVCWRCGAFDPEKRIDPGPLAICRACGHPHPSRRLPLLLIGGASCAGKSSVCQALLGQLPEVVLLDSDIIWQPAFDTPADGYRAFFTTWLRLCLSIAQAGRPVALFGAGVGVPANLEPLPERRYFSALRYLGLTCDDQLLAERLRQRPAWRGAGGDAFIAGQQQFNRWYRERGPHGDPPLTLVDTGAGDLSASAAAVADWIRGSLGGEP